MTEDHRSWKKKITLTERQEASLCAMYQAGHPIARIKQRFDLSEKQVKNVLSRNGVPLRKVRVGTWL